MSQRSCLGLGVEIVKNDVDLPLGMLGHDLVHEIEKLDAQAAAVMLGADLAAGDVEGCEQGGGAVPLVIVRLAAERAPIGQLEIALGPFSSAWIDGFSSTTSTSAPSGGSR